MLKTSDPVSRLGPTQAEHQGTRLFLLGEIFNYKRSRLGNLSAFQPTTIYDATAG